MDHPSTTQLGSVSHVVGDLRSEDEIRIEGILEGTAATTGRLVVGPAGTVTGNLFAHDLTIEGKVTGDVVATGQLEIGSCGVLLGDIRAAGLNIRDGGTFRGQVQMVHDSQPELPPFPAADDEEAESLGEPAVDPPEVDEPPPAWDTDEHRQAEDRAQVESAYPGADKPEIPQGRPPTDEEVPPPRRSIDQLNIVDPPAKKKDPLGVD